MLRRKTDAAKQPQIVAADAPRPTRDQFVASRGADQGELDKVIAFAEAAGLQVLESDAARRSVVVQGSVAAVDKAFAVQLNDYQYERGKYRSHDGAVKLPANIAASVEAVVGLTDRPVRAVHFSTARRRNPADPPNTKPLTPQQVATLYGFPAGDGSGQTIGLYEMETGDGPAGYSVDGVSNSGKSDGETGLDITVAGATSSRTPRPTRSPSLSRPEILEPMSRIPARRRPAIPRAIHG